METIYTMIARLYTGMYDRIETEDVGAGFVEYAAHRCAHLDRGVHGSMRRVG